MGKSHFSTGGGILSLVSSLSQDKYLRTTRSMLTNSTDNIISASCMRGQFAKYFASNDTAAETIVLNWNQLYPLFEKSVKDVCLAVAILHQGLNKLRQTDRLLRSIDLYTAVQRYSLFVFCVGVFVVSCKK